MKNTKPHVFFGSIFLLGIITGCQSQKEEGLMPVNTAELEIIIGNEVDRFYEVYRQSDYDWIDFFEDDFTNIFPDTLILKITNDSTMTLWKGIYDRYAVQLISRGKPAFFTSEDKVISHTRFNEIFINKQSRDTRTNIGMYIVVWRRRLDDSWKIVF